MKKILYIIPFLFLSNIANAGFVVDHTNTNLDNIPNEWITKAKEDLHVDYSHTSHGSQLITGMNALESFPDFGTEYAWMDDSTGDTSNLSLDDHYGSDLSTGDADDDSDGIANWAEDTYTLLDNSSNNHINVILWSWCNISGHDIDRYIRSMEWLMAQFSTEGSTYTDAVMTTPATPHARVTEHPVQFVFITAHANGGGEGDSSDVPNEQIRAHVATYDRMLFDFSDMENYDPDDNYYLDKLLQDDLDYDSDSNGSVDSNWASEYLTLHDDSELDQLTHGDGVAGYDGAGSCAHSDGPDNDARLNCVLKGRAVWYLFARLAGWDGNNVWAESAGGNYTDLCNSFSHRGGSEGAYDAVVDADGNVYVTGEMNSDSADIFGITLTLEGSKDAFVAKIDKNQNTIWVKQIKSSSHVHKPRIAIDSAGNIFAAGYFLNSLDIDSTTLSSAGGGYDGYLIEFNGTTGNLVQADNFGNTSPEYINSIFIDDSDYIYISGTVNGGTDIFGATTTGFGNNDGFVAKIDSDRNGIWAKQEGSDGADVTSDVAVDSSGNVYVTGTFENTADVFGTSLTAGGVDNWSDGFLAKLDSDGVGVWVKQVGSGEQARDYVDSVAIDESDNVYAIGRFQEDASVFGQSLTGIDRENIFVSKLGADGTVDWMKHMASASSAYSNHVEIGDKVYVSGAFHGTMTSDSESVTSNGSLDIFLATFDKGTGSTMSIDAYGDTSYDSGEAVAVNGEYTYLVGRFKNSMDVEGTTLTSSGCYDAFVQKVSGPGTATPTDTTPPTVTEITPVPTPTNDNTPDYTFNSDEAGTIVYGGDCTGKTSVASAGNNTINLNALADGEHSNCTITVTDSSGNTSLILNMSTFTIDTTPPATPTVAPDLNPSSDSGTSNTDNYTSDATPMITAMCSAGNKLTLYSDGIYQTFTNCTVDALININAHTLTDGNHSITYTLEDAVGNESAHSSSLGIIIDTTAPTITSITRDTPTQQITNETTVIFAVAFSGSNLVNNVDVTDFENTGTAGGTVSNVGSNPSHYLVTISGLSEGTVNLTTAAGQNIIDDAGNAYDNNEGSEEEYIIDLTVPDRYDGNPSGTEASGTTSVELHLNTEDDATCKYAESAGTDYASMNDMTLQTGGDVHRHQVSGLSDGNTYTYYIRCTEPSGNTNNDDFEITFNIDGTDTNPTISEVTPAETPTTDDTPNYTFNSDEAGTITYGGDCDSSTTNATVGDNVITFNKLSSGVHDNCTIVVTDNNNNDSNTLNVSTFEIEQTKTPIYRLYNKKTGTQLYTRGETDRKKILGKYKDYEFTDGAPAFYASTSDDGNTPMYRLYNTRTGAQLYTKGEADRDKILAKWSDFEYTDGAPAFYAAMSSATGLTPIFRLYNTRTGMHLYTKGISDREKILSKYPDFEFTDGSPAFYAEVN